MTRSKYNLYILKFLEKYSASVYKIYAVLQNNNNRQFCFIITKSNVKKNILQLLFNFFLRKAR